MVLPANLNMRPGWRTEIERQIRAAKGNCYELDLFKQFLVSDLRQSCSGSLPAGLNERCSSPRVLRGAYVLQVEDWANIGVDEETRRAQIDASVKLDGQGASARRTVMLTLSDGVSEISALEAEALPHEVNLALKKYAIPGLKIVVKGGVVRHGTILLTKNSVKVLGGALAGSDAVNMGSGAGPPGNSSEGGGRVNGSREQHSASRSSSEGSAKANNSSSAGGSNIERKSEASAKRKQGMRECPASEANKRASGKQRAEPTVSSSACSESISPHRQSNAAMKGPTPGARPSSSSPSSSAQRPPRPPLCDSIREWLRSTPRGDRSQTGKAVEHRVRVHAFVSGVERYTASNLGVRLDDGRHLTTCTASHGFHCDLLGLDAGTTSASHLHRAFAKKAAQAKVGRLLATLSGVFELCQVGGSGTSSQDELRIEAFHPITPRDEEELKAFYRRLRKKRKRAVPTP